MFRQNFFTLLNYIFVVFLFQIGKSTNTYSVSNEVFYEKFSHSSEIQRHIPTHIIPKSVFHDHMDLQIENSALTPRNINNISEENNWGYNHNILKYDPIFKKSNLLQKRDLKIPELPKPDIPKLPSDLPSLPSRKDLPKIPSVDLPEIPKVDLPNTSKLPKLPDLQKIPKVDLPKIPGVLNRKLYEPSDSEVFHKYNRNLQKRNLPDLPGGMPKLPELPNIPSVDLPELPLPKLPEIPIPSLPKMPEIPHISLLNHDQFYPSYVIPQYKKISPTMKINSPKTKRAVTIPNIIEQKQSFLNIPNIMPQNDYVRLRANEKNYRPDTSLISNDNIKLMSVPPTLPVLIPISRPMKPIKAAHKSYPRRQKNCDEEKVTYREKTKITILDKDSDESSSSSSSEENIFSKILPKSWNLELFLKPLSPIQDTFSNARKSHSHTKPRREDECVDEIVIEDVTEIVLTGSDDSSERRLRDTRNENDNLFSNLHFQLVLPNYRTDLIKAQHYSDDGVKQINTLKQRDGRGIDVKKISSTDSMNENKRRKRSKPRRKQGETVIIEEETVILEVEEDIQKNEKQSKPKRTQETDIIEEEIVIVEIDEDKSFNEGDKKFRDFKGETKMTKEKKVIDEKIDESYDSSEDEDDIEDDDSTRKKREALENFSEPGLNNAQRDHEKIMITDNPPLTDRQIGLTTGKIENLAGKALKSDKNSYENSYQKSKSEEVKLREFLKQLQEKAKHSIHNVDVEVNNNLLLDENSLKETNGRGKRSPVKFVATNPNSSTRRNEGDLKQSKLLTDNESEDLKEFFNILREKAKNSEYNVELQINERLLADKNSLKDFNGKGTSLTVDHDRVTPKDDHEISFDKLDLVANSKTENLRNFYKKPREKSKNAEYNAELKVDDKFLLDRNLMKVLNDRKKRSAPKLKSYIKEQNFANSKLVTSTETENLKGFFKELQEIEKNSEYNIQLEINEEILREVGLINNERVRNKRSPNPSYKNKYSTHKLNEDFPGIERDLEGGDLASENDINRDKRKANSDGKVEFQEEVEVTIVEVEENDGSGSKTKTNKKTKTIKEVEDESSSEVTTKKQTTTTTTTTTPSTTSEFSEEEETTEYDYELDEEPCPTDFFGTAIQKVQCILNSITSKVIGMEFGPGCC